MWGVSNLDQDQFQSFSHDFKAKEPDFKPSCYYTNTKAREINDSKIIAIDYYYLEKLFKWFTEY